MKKILSACLSLLMLLSIAPITANAQTFSGSCGENTYWQFDSYYHTLYIYGSGKVEYDGWFEYDWEDIQGEINYIEIGEYITGFGTDSILTSPYDELYDIYVDPDNAYLTTVNGNLYNKSKNILVKYCIGSSATSFTVPSKVTTVRHHAFTGSRYLEKIIFPQNVTTIGTNYFGCKYDCISKIYIYNKDCKLASGATAGTRYPIDVYGYNGSKAKLYCNNSGDTFHSLNSKISKLTAKSKAFKVTWTKKTTCVTGYLSLIHI